MTDEQPTMKDMLDDDPYHCVIWNAALRWVLGIVQGVPVEKLDQQARELCQILKGAIERGYKPTDFQKSFFEAIRNDPYMSLEHKAYWLQFEGEPEKRPELELIEVLGGPAEEE